MIRFVERRGYDGVFAPGFEPHGPPEAPADDVGLAAVDHVVANVELGQMDRWVKFFAETMGFSEMLHFDDEAISTEYSALMSKVMQDGAGRIKFPHQRAPRRAAASRRWPSISTTSGAPACSTSRSRPANIVETVSRMRARGVAFLPVPDAYYDDLGARVPAVAPYVGELARLGILADRDEDGYLLQVFTQPVQDRPTLFFEVIERRGARGFGQGNFKSLFEAMEREQARRGNLVEAVAS